MIIAIVGSGGKTTLLKKLAAGYRAEGKTVFITTTTHMFIEEDTLLTDDADRILRKLKETGCVIAGIPEGEKIRALSKETFETVSACADVTLVEADGSKHLPLKYPNELEPVIPDNTDRIIVVWGPHGLGQSVGSACHRPELVMECLGIREDTLMTREHVRKLLQEGYLIPLKSRYPNAEITVYPSL